MTIPWMHNCPHSDDSWCLDCVIAMGNEMDALRAELAAARENEARYLWLRDWSADNALFYLSVNETYAGKRFKPAEVDAHIDALAAIDAARRAGGDEG